MTISEKAARDSLKKHLAWAHAFHDDLITGMRADGLIHDDGVVNAADAVTAAAAGMHRLSPLQAAALASNNPRTMALYRKVAAQSARYGIDFGGDGVLDIYAIDAKLRAAQVPLESRLNYKAALHELRCI